MNIIFSYLILIITFPFKLLRKITKNEFVAGLIFGAIFSLVVNVITVRMTEEIQKQRILEALENEIVSNTLQAENIMKEKQEELDKNNIYNPFIPVRKYSRDLWEQSSEPLQYVAQLDQETQIKVQIYYSFTIPYDNAAIDNVEKFCDSQLTKCLSPNLNIPIKDDQNCLAWYQFRLKSERDNALDVSSQGLEVLKVFHPTKNRLNNWFLRLIMGNKSTRILSGK